MSRIAPYREQVFSQLQVDGNSNSLLIEHAQARAAVSNPFFAGHIEIRERFSLVEWDAQSLKVEVAEVQAAKRVLLGASPVEELSCMFEGIGCSVMRKSFRKVCLARCSTQCVE